MIKKILTTQRSNNAWDGFRDISLKQLITQVSENEIITNFKMFKNVELHKKWILLTMTFNLNSLVNCQYDVIMIKFDILQTMGRSKTFPR